jgi:hypothetical protein
MVPFYYIIFTIPATILGHSGTPFSHPPYPFRPMGISTEHLGEVNPENQMIISRLMAQISISIIHMEGKSKIKSFLVLIYFSKCFFLTLFSWDM